jgi:hypothetical protein
VNRVPLYVIMLLGTPNLYMIFLMNSTALAVVIEVAGFTSIHFMIHCNEDMCESAFSFLKWTYQIKPPCGERPSDRYDLQLMRRHVFLASKKLTTFTLTNKGVGIEYGSGPKEPMHVCLPYDRPGSRVTATNPCMDVLQNSTTFIWGDTFH